MKTSVLGIRLSERDKERFNALALEKEISKSDLFVELLRNYQENDLLQQIYVNTSLLRCAFSAHLNDTEKKKTSEIWEKEKANLGIEE